MTDRDAICTEVRQKLSAYLDSELSAVEALGMDGHLEECTGCAQELEELREAVGWLGAKGRRVPSAPPWEQVEATVLGRSTSTGRFGRGWLSRESVLAATIAALALLGLLWAARGGIEQRDSEARSPTDIGAEIRLAGLPGFDSFLIAHQAEEVSPQELGPQLDFRPHVPEELPGGYQLAKAYVVRGAGRTGSCLLYRRGQEVVGLVQQSPSQQVDWGSTKLRDCSFAGSHCRLGKSQGVELLQIEPDGRNLTVVSKAGSLNSAQMVRTLLGGATEPEGDC